MTSQYAVIGIAIGVFFAGLGIGYAIFQSTSAPNFMQMSPQQMQTMMNDPNFRQSMMNQWMQNPQMMQNWMNPMMTNPTLREQMAQTMMGDQGMMNTMMSNPQWSQQMMDPMMGYMMNDPQLQQQMMGTMMQNPQFMQNMMANPQFQQNWMSPMMGQGMMSQGMVDSGMMGGNMMMGNWMMGQPITQSSDVLSTISNIEDLLDQVSSEYRNGNKDTAFSLATTAYLENYEYIEGTIASKDLQLMQKIELMMRVDLRSLIQNGKSADEVDAKIDSIKTEFAKAKKLFS